MLSSSDSDHLAIALNILNLKEEEIVFLNTNYVETVAQEHRQLRPIHNYQGMIRRAEELLITGGPLDWVLGLAFLTGRRAAEVGSTACFGIVDATHVRFSGQLKTKTRESHPYVIPVLTKSKNITETLATLRKERSRWLDNPRYFKDTASSPLSKKVKKHFGEFILDPRVKDLRAAYAEVAYKLFGSPDIAKSRFFSDILGHGENDIVTGQSYIDFYLES
jgi:integrase